MKCYCCEDELNDTNKSIEHVFINAIGGKLKSNKLLCKKCNNDLGNKLDSELAKQCNFLMNFLLLEREKGSYQAISGKTEDGEEFILNGAEIKNKSNYNIERNGDNINASFSGSDEKDLKKFLRQLKNKVPQVNVEEIIENVNPLKYYLNEPVTVNTKVGGEIAMRAIAKIAVNYYILNGGNRSPITPIIDYIKKGSSSKFVHYYYKIDNNRLKVDNENIFHYINLVGSSTEKTLYCYIELFGALKFIVILSFEYQGKNVNHEYCYNLISKDLIETNIKLNLTQEHLKNALNGKCFDIKDISSGLSKVLNIGHIRQDKKHLNRLIEEALKKTFGKHDEGTKITEDILNEFINEISNSYAIYMTRQNHNKKRVYLK